MPEHVRLFEVGPRDGLQNEAAFVPTPDKIALIDALSATGLTRIEVTSFVSPKWVPQMADAAEVMTGIRRAPGIRYGVLTPNLTGFERAMQTNPGEIAIFGAASEGFSQANINCSIAESLARFAPVTEAAAARGVPVRGYVSCVTNCPYDGPVPPAKVAEVARALLDMGCYEISLGDTIGAARPESTARMLEAVTAQIAPAQLAGHFHDTGGRALENIALCLDAGLRVFDTAIGGLGGCPYAPGAPGNVATESVARFLRAEGFETGLDLERIEAAARYAQTLREAA